MNPDQIAALNDDALGKSPSEIIEVALAQADGQAIVTTNFRPYEAVILHLAATQNADIPVLWVDHGTNLAETYVFAEKSRASLSLNLNPYLPLMTAAHWLAINGGQVPMPIPSDHSLCGGIVDFQCLVLDAGASQGIAFSPGLELVLGM